MRDGVDEKSGNLLFLADPDGSDLRRLSDLRIGGADWAPDGRSILVSGAGRLYSVDVATGHLTPHVIRGNPSANLGNPQWSPDGTRILFTMNVGTGLSDFYTMRPDGTDVVQVTTDPERDYFADWGTYPLDR